MNRRELTEELGDFFERRNRFAACDDYLGMAASRTHEVFVGYFDGLGDADRRRLADILVAAALGEVAALAPHVGEAASLLLSLCLHGRGQHLARGRGALEREFNRPVNLRAWAEAGDEESSSGPAHKRDWRYALKLWGVLYLLRSERIGTGYEHLLARARSRHFRRALAGARAMYDSGVLEG